MQSLAVALALKGFSPTGCLMGHPLVKSKDTYIGLVMLHSVWVMKAFSLDAFTDLGMMANKNEDL